MLDQTMQISPSAPNNQDQPLQNKNKIFWVGILLIILAIIGVLLLSSAYWNIRFISARYFYFIYFSLMPCAGLLQLIQSFFIKGWRYMWLWRVSAFITLIIIPMTYFLIMTSSGILAFLLILLGAYFLFCLTSIFRLIFGLLNKKYYGWQWIVYAAGLLLFMQIMPFITLFSEISFDTVSQFISFYIPIDIFLQGMAWVVVACGYKETNIFKDAY